MKNPRITKREQGLLKGAIRRVFSRSELRQSIMTSMTVKGYVEPNRPRVKKWSTCAVCSKIHPSYLMAVDHINPVIPVTSTFEDMSLDEVVNRMWCEEKYLQVICETCHDNKTSEERKERTKNKRNKVKK